MEKYREIINDSDEKDNFSDFSMWIGLTFTTEQKKHMLLWG